MGLRQIPALLNVSVTGPDLLLSSVGGDGVRVVEAGAGQQVEQGAVRPVDPARLTAPVQVFQTMSVPSAVPLSSGIMQPPATSMVPVASTAHSCESVPPLQV
jgi:hypothetical protein